MAQQVYGSQKTGYHGKAADEAGPRTTASPGSSGAAAGVGSLATRR